MTTPRLDPTDGWHHITSHSVEDRDLFANDQDRWRFLRLLGVAATKFKVEVVSYCLMGNHYHLVLHCPNQGVSEFMHYVNGIYARSYNQRHTRIGRLFRANFHNVLIVDDGQLIFTTRYVDRNPLELGFDIRRYAWSSYSAYLEPDRVFSIVPLHAAVPLGIVGGPSSYRSFVETDNATDKFRLTDGSKIVRIDPYLPPHVLLSELLELARQLAATAPKSSAAQREAAKAAAVLIGHELGVGSGKEAQEFFAFTSTASYNSFLFRARDKATADPVFYGRVREAWAQRGVSLGQVS